MISVVIPTIKGREDHLERCCTAYNETSPPDFQLIVIRDKPTCGAAWQEGGHWFQEDYIHFTADDLEPHEGWWQAAKAVADAGKLPCPRIFQPDGALESCGKWGTEMPEGTETDIARVPFLTRQMWERSGWILDAHYYTDNAIWWRGQQLGIPTVVCRDYAFTHHWALEGRLETIDEDQLKFERWKEQAA